MLIETIPAAFQMDAEPALYELRHDASGSTRGAGTTCSPSSSTSGTL
ncbi:hypothetical protein QJS66_10725 [Kocuria rhizophila]|nr:hypothetical protein QJS66_10725 [Kocuria rhizophila]